MLVYQRVILVASSPSSLADDLFFPEGTSLSGQVCETYFLGLVRMRYTSTKKTAQKDGRVYIVGNLLNPQR